MKCCHVTAGRLLPEDFGPAPDPATPEWRDPDGEWQVAEPTGSIAPDDATGPVPPGEVGGGQKRPQGGLLRRLFGG